MGRYEQEESKRYFSFKTILILIFLMAIVFLFYQRTQGEQEKETVIIDVPIKKNRLLDKKELSLENVLVPESVEGKEFEEVELKQVSAITIELPNLDNSDDSFQLAVVEVSKDLVSWFTVKNSLRKYIVLINDFSQNQILFKHRSFLKMPQKIVVKNDKQGLYLAREGYKRFDQFANAIAAIDINKGVSLYLSFRPLFMQIYNEFSYPSHYRLEDIFLKAAASVIDAPRIETRIALVKHSIRYKFLDENLEGLNDVEKQMLRMGPVNTQKIQTKLRELVQAISKLDES